MDCPLLFDMWRVTAVGEYYLLVLTTVGAVLFKDGS